MLSDWHVSKMMDRAERTDYGHENPWDCDDEVRDDEDDEQEPMTHV